jgi:ATP-dependent DNA helicase PIF1
MSHIELSNEQKYAFNMFKNGENIFITGPGGTGKTKLIETFVEYMSSRGIKHQVCAMTGCATVLLNKCKARTLHSWSGIKLAKGDIERVVYSVSKNKFAAKEWRSIKVLIIDEVSMMSKKIFDILDLIGKSIKHNQRPFGGIQLIFTGDFYQLPPVGNINEPETSQFCFESENWYNVFPLRNHIELKTMFRQKDADYIRILSQIRTGEIDEKSIEILRRYVKRDFDSECGLRPTKLFAIRSKTDYVNQSMYSKLGEPEFHFNMEIKTDCVTFIDSGKAIHASDIEMCSKLSPDETQFQIDQVINTRNISKKLSLKKGTIVMCTVNIDMDNAICNGSQGVVVDFEVGTKIPIILFSNGIRKRVEVEYFQSTDYPTICVGQVPLSLAWALTIHKIQGASLNIADMDLGNSVFEYGQTYVALSRVKSLDGLYLSAFNPNRIRANPLVKSFYSNIPEISYSCADYGETRSSEKADQLMLEEYSDPNIKRIYL